MKLMVFKLTVIFEISSRNSLINVGVQRKILLFQSTLGLANTPFGLLRSGSSAQPWYFFLRSYCHFFALSFLLSKISLHVCAILRRYMLLTSVPTHSRISPMKGAILLRVNISTVNPYLTDHSKIHIVLYCRIEEKRFIPLRRGNL